MSSGHGDGNNRKQEQCIWWCAACGGQYDWRAPNRILVIQVSVDPREAKVFRAHAAPQGLCDNLINSLKFLTNQQKDGDSPVESIVTGRREKSHKVHRTGQSRSSERGRLATGMHFVKPCTKESKVKIGKRCNTAFRTCTRRWEPRSLGRIKGQGLFAKDREDQFHDLLHLKDTKKEPLGLWEEHL